MRAATAPWGATRRRGDFYFFGGHPTGPRPETAGTPAGGTPAGDPGMGVIRHADAGYDEAIDCVRERGVVIPRRRE